MPPINSSLTGVVFTRKARPNASKKTGFCAVFLAPVLMETCPGRYRVGFTCTSFGAGQFLSVARRLLFDPQLRLDCARDANLGPSKPAIAPSCRLRAGQAD